MTITYTTMLVAQICNSNDYIQTYFNFDHELTKKDLEEFVQWKGYSDYKSYFKDYIEDEDQLSETLEDADKDSFLVENDIIVYCEDEESLRDFITEKYREKALKAFLNQLEELPLISIDD